MILPYIEPVAVTDSYEESSLYLLADEWMEFCRVLHEPDTGLSWCPWAVWVQRERNVHKVIIRVLLLVFFAEGRESLLHASAVSLRHEQTLYCYVSDLGVKLNGVRSCSRIGYPALNGQLVNFELFLDAVYLDITGDRLESAVS